MDTSPDYPLVPRLDPLPLLPTAAADAERLLAAFLEGRSPQTVRAYRQDLQDFAAFLGVADPAGAVHPLLGNGHGAANGIALHYRARLLERRLAPATVNRRLAALRSLVQLARTLGLVPWALEVPGVRGEAYRDTAGPGRKGFARLLAAVSARSDAKGLRDRAILRLLHDLGLRRAEVCRLDVGDLDAGAGTLAVLGKGRREKVRLTLPAPTREALLAWLAVRPGEQGPEAPLFVGLDRSRKGGGRLSGKGCYHLVRALGNAVGLKVWPHAIRHTAITAALDATRGDVRKVQAFSRHRDVRVLLRYDDNRRDAAGEVAERVARSAG